jgi:protein-tyrosine phosphatase
MVRVLFVCLGNICRSPMAQGAFERALKHHDIALEFEVDSAGTSDWHVGEMPDKRAIQCAKKAGIDISTQRARQIKKSDFETFDYIMAMDASNHAKLAAIQTENSKAKLALFLNYQNQFAEKEVPDPYFGGDQGFEHVLELVTAASEGLLLDIQQRFQS